MRRRVLAILALCLLLTRPAAAAVAFDAVVSEQEVNTASSLTWSHTVTGTNPFIFVAVYYNAAAGSITGVTYNSVALTLADDAVVGSGFHAASYYLLAPSTGAHNVVVSASASIRIFGASTSYTGVQQFDTHIEGHGSSTSPSQSLTTVKDNTWTVGAIGNGSGWAAASMTAGTLRTSGAATLGVVQIADTNANKSPAGSTTISFSDGSNPNYFIGLVSMSSDAPAATTNGRMFLVF